MAGKYNSIVKTSEYLQSIEFGIGETDNLPKISNLFFAQENNKRHAAERAIKPVVAKPVIDSLTRDERIEVIKFIIANFHAPKVVRHPAFRRTYLPIVAISGDDTPMYWEWPQQPIRFGAKHPVIFGELEFHPEAEKERQAKMLKLCAEMAYVTHSNARRVSGGNADEYEEIVAASNLINCETVTRFSGHGPIWTLAAIRLASARADWRNTAKRASEFGSNVEMDKTVYDAEGNAVEVYETLDAAVADPEDLVIEAEDRHYDAVTTAEMKGELPWLKAMSLNPAMKVLNAVHKFASKKYIEAHGGIEKYAGLTGEQLAMTVKELYNSFIMPGKGTESEAEDKQTVAWQDKIRLQRVIPGETPYFVSNDGKVFTYWEGKGTKRLVMDTSPVYMPREDESNTIDDTRERKPSWMAEEVQPFEDSAFFNLENVAAGWFLRRETLGFKNPEGWAPGDTTGLLNCVYFNAAGEMKVSRKWHKRRGIFVWDGTRTERDGLGIPVVYDWDQLTLQYAKEDGWSGTLNEFLDHELDKLGTKHCEDYELMLLRERLLKDIPAVDRDTRLSQNYVMGFIEAARNGRGFEQCVEAGKASHKAMAKREAPQGASTINEGATLTQMAKEAKKMSENTGKRTLSDVILQLSAGKKPSKASWEKAFKNMTYKKVTDVKVIAHGGEFIAFAHVGSSGGGTYNTTIGYTQDNLGNRHMTGGTCTCEAGGECYHAAALAQKLSRM